MASGEQSTPLHPDTTNLETLVDRLRGIYRIPIRDGLGPVGAGDEPDNPHEYVRSDFVTPPIQRAAAAEIERLRAVIRVNGLRAGATHAEIDEVIYGKR